jgi:excisionase family DNA binding protein
MSSTPPILLPSDKLAFSIAAAARAADFGRSTLYEALAAGQLKAVKLGRRTLILRAELQRFLDALPPARQATNAP